MNEINYSKVLTRVDNNLCQSRMQYSEKSQNVLNYICTKNSKLEGQALRGDRAHHKD